MILELDIGNSRIKWRMWDSGTKSVFSEGAAAAFSELIVSLESQNKPGMIRAANVRADDLLQQIISWAEATWQLDVHVAEVSSHCGGVTNGYEDIRRMGVDRWLALLAAYARTQTACVVVDGGTALTIDILAADGQHLGGYILPGLTLMTGALEQSTGIRLQDKEFQSTISPGLITEAAVRNGCLGATIALIEQCLKMGVSTENNSGLVVTGGDAQLLMDTLAQRGVKDIQHCPYLVLDGLDIACPVATQVNER